VCQSVMRHSYNNVVNIIKSYVIVIKIRMKLVEFRWLFKLLTANERFVVGYATFQAGYYVLA
jgi:hypothetical protein